MPSRGCINVPFGTHPEGAQFCVGDTDPDIARKHLRRVTRRFYRVDKSRSRETGSTGLGLAIVKHAPARDGGRLEIESDVGRRSRFRVVLPAYRLRCCGPVEVPQIECARRLADFMA